jgi:hypothetical protein
MPYKSQAQRGKFHQLELEGKISRKTVREFDEASKGLKLPLHVRRKKRAGRKKK